MKNKVKSVIQATDSRSLTYERLILSYQVGLKTAVFLGDLAHQLEEVEVTTQCRREVRGSHMTLFGSAFCIENN